jgi:hypothetical protein
LKREDFPHWSLFFLSIIHKRHQLHSNCLFSLSSSVALNTLSSSLSDFFLLCLLSGVKEEEEEEDGIGDDQGMDTQTMQTKQIVSDSRIE